MASTTNVNNALPMEMMEPPPAYSSVIPGWRPDDPPLDGVIGPGEQVRISWRHRGVVRCMAGLDRTRGPFAGAFCDPPDCQRAVHFDLLDLVRQLVCVACLMASWRATVRLCAHGSGARAGPTALFMPCIWPHLCQCARCGSPAGACLPEQRCSTFPLSVGILFAVVLSPVLCIQGCNRRGENRCARQPAPSYLRAHGVDFPQPTQSIALPWSPTEPFVGSAPGPPHIRILISRCPCPIRLLENPSRPCDREPRVLLLLPMLASRPDCRIPGVCSIRGLASVAHSVAARVQ
jgi:hypothetical protein